MYIRGDFHIHTAASDGKLSAKQVAQKARNAGLDIIAITDHDTTEGIGCLELSFNDVKIIPGIELSTIYNGESIHILGYFRDGSYKNSSFQNFLSDMKNYRKQRAEKIINNLNHFFNIKLDFDYIYKEAEGIIARPHLAKAIIEAGYPYSWSEIFDKFLSKDSPAYVPNKEISVAEGIKLLKGKDAVVVLAHPVLIKNSSLEELLSFDFDGIECIYSQNSEEETKRLTGIAESRNILVTAGSDFHGIDSRDTSHGFIGNPALSGPYLEKFVKALGI